MAGAASGTIDTGTVSPLSDFPLTFEHGLSVFPLHTPDFSLNFDGMYDFTTYKHEKHTRMVLGGSAEFVLGPVPLRFGTLWDGRGQSSIDHGTVSPISDYPLTFEHGLSVFPLHTPDFSLNFDGVHDFTTYKHEKHTRTLLGGSAEFVLGPVPLRFGTQWDGRGKSSEDDRLYVAGGIGYVRAPKDGGVGVDIGAGVRQQVTGPGLGGQLETVISVNLGLRIRPNL